MHNVTVTDRWVVVKVITDDGDLYKVLASFHGSYTMGESWRLNSGITRVEAKDNGYYFYGFSGSCYFGQVGSYGTNLTANGVLKKLLETGKVELIGEDFNFENIKLD